MSLMLTARRDGKLRGGMDGRWPSTSVKRVAEQGVAPGREFWAARTFKRVAVLATPLRTQSAQDADHALVPQDGISLHSGIFVYLERS